MPQRRRIDPAEGVAALRRWVEGQRPAGGPMTGSAGGPMTGSDGGPMTGSDGEPAPRAIVATAVRWALEEVAARYPGSTCEVRVPPFGVVQCLPGPRHTRGTPPNVVEADAETWLGLVTGRLAWPDAVASGRLRASGERADLSAVLPLN